QIQNVRVARNVIDANSLCFPIALFSNYFHYQIVSNIITSPGATSTSHCTNSLGATNAYGILVYDLNSDGNPPTDGIIGLNTIYNAKAAGIYFAGDGVSTARLNNSWKTIITGNKISLQTHTDHLLPRGGIAVGLASDITIVGNELYDNLTGVD